jgi:hypothetical protein
MNQPVEWKKVIEFVGSLTALYFAATWVFVDELPAVGVSFELH